MDEGNSHEIAFSMTVQRDFQCQSLKLILTHFYTERDKRIKACDALVTLKTHFNVNYTAKMPFIVQSWIVQVLHVFSSR